jgi:N-acyl amino acid synthase of PEP-CTERM/exosortase system
LASLINGFLFKRVDRSDKHLMEMIYRLRFEVYAKQCNFINEGDYPLELESDEYDKDSVHFAAINPRGMVVATARIILPQVQLSPLLKTFPHLTSEYSPEIENIAEISRFMICKKSRHSVIPDGDLSSISLNNFRFRSGNRLPDHAQFSKAFSPGIIIQGLCQEIFREMQKRGIKYWCALMEKSLGKLLSKYGFKLECVGERTDFYGPVRPYVGIVSEFQTTRLVDTFSFNLNTPSNDPEERILRLLKEKSRRTLFN